MKIEISSVIRILVVTYVFLCIYIFFTQKNLMFFPDKETLFFPTYQNLEEVNIKTEDNINLYAWYMDNESDKTVIFFHWNWWNIFTNQKRLKIFKDLKINAIMFDYRWYWKSEWEIKVESDLYKDAEAVYKYILDKWVKPEQIILRGQSLGASIAIDLAQNKDLYSVIAESTFYSMDTMAKKQYSYLPIKLLLKFHFKNYEKILNVRSPVMVIHSKNDETTDFQEWKDIYDLIKWEKFFLETTGSHNWDFLDSYWIYYLKIKKFLKIY